MCEHVSVVMCRICECISVQYVRCGVYVSMYDVYMCVNVSMCEMICVCMYTCCVGSCVDSTLMALLLLSPSGTHSSQKGPGAECGRPRVVGLTFAPEQHLGQFITLSQFPSSLQKTAKMRKLHPWNEEQGPPMSLGHMGEGLWCRVSVEPLCTAPHQGLEASSEHCPGCSPSVCHTLALRLRPKVIAGVIGPDHSFLCCPWRGYKKCS